PEAPYRLTFTVDASALGGVAPADVQVFRDGVVVAGCTHGSAAVPDPCVAARGFAPDGSGDAVIQVRTSAFSTWSLGLDLRVGGRLVVEPVLVKRTGLLGLTVSLGTLSARLTSDTGAALAGKRVTFTTGGHPLCAAITDARG